jgi:hypothetical protein
MDFPLPAQLLILVIAGSAMGQQASAQTPNSSTDSVAWGSPVNALRLGIAFGSDPSKLTLRVLLQNVGSDFEEVLIGHEYGATFYPSMNFLATSPTGEEREGWWGQSRPIAGRILPMSLRLNAGTIHEREFLLKDIIYPSQTTVTLDTLVKRQWSVRLRFEVKQPDPKSFPNFDFGWPSSLGVDQLHAWIGLLDSPSISTLH